MYPRPFEYTRPETVAEAIEALASGAGEARAIAGGQTLVPMMSLGLAAPDLLVDIGRLPLAGTERVNGSVALGALTRHRELERSDELARQVPLAAEAAHYIGNPRVRNRGTLGGSLSHADPASELGAVALAYGGTVVIAGPDGERSVPIDDFFKGYFTTAVGSGELLTRVELELPAPGTATASARSPTAPTTSPPRRRPRSSPSTIAAPARRRAWRSPGSAAARCAASPPRSCAAASGSRATSSTRSGAP